MILGVDTGLATCGWALLDEKACSFVDLGVVLTEPIEGGKVTLDRARRSSKQARILAEKIQGCTAVVVEQMSFPGGKACGVCRRRSGANQITPIALSWGVVLGLVAMLDPRPRLLTIAPQRWQRAILPNAERRVDYDELAHNAGRFLLSRHPRAAKALESIKPSAWNHAIDAAMLALVGALDERLCERIAA